ncbi:helix-turn-helix domain-containing protein [Streptomyces hygroscopicus]|uniref:helix-turn-helix domain-containing protein n=1 Tax=Streptomyces hygroscopicus TaxID=1912 RepID=UPI002AD4EC68|nr:helix-turn-helix domain-containing protein [Streptomyces hygroscopicus]
MRYPQGGGLTAERRGFREHIRMQAAELFALGHDNAAIAKQLRVSVRSVQRWHQAWAHGGTPALESKGPASRPKLGEALFEALEQELAKGPVARGWPDQTWTLARIKTLIGRRFPPRRAMSAMGTSSAGRGSPRMSPRRVPPAA